MKSCCICLCDCEESIICPSIKCSTVVCVECFEELANHCLQEGKMIACTNNLCEQHYHKKIIPKQLHPLYFKVTHNYLSKTHSETIENENAYQGVVKTIRDDRQKFIQNNHPKAVSIVASVAYADMLKKVSKNNEKLKKAAASSRRCMNFVCKGKMVEENGVWKCLVCKKKFCSKCEVEYAKLGHVCRKEDLESVKTVGDMVKCPKCRCPAVKSQGCNNITCAVCRTNFDYVSGERSNAGNHTTDVAIGLKGNDSLLEMFPEVNNEMKRLLAKIDSKHPKIPSLLPTINALKKGGSAEIVGSKYSNYIEQSCDCENYVEVVGLIEKKNREEGGLTEEFLISIIEAL